VLVVLAGEPLYGLPGVKSHDRDELHLVIVARPAEELNPLVPGYVPSGDPREDLFLKKPLVSVRVLEGCPPVPDSSYHAVLLRM
jgi:hypothetical protein